MGLLCRCDEGWEGRDCRSPSIALSTQLKDDFESSFAKLYDLNVGGATDEACGDLGFGRALHFNQVKILPQLLFCYEVFKPESKRSSFRSYFMHKM